ncbi:RDD family protein [bacterium]|nr:RDD family protein [bacterium]
MNIENTEPAIPLKKPFVGIWIRILSDFLDIFLLSVLAFAVTFVFRDHFEKLGEKGVWVGLLITFFYTSLLHSSLGNGQTLSKRILKIQVLDLDGKPLNLNKSFLRSLVMVTMVYGDNIIAAFGILNYPTFQMIWLLIDIILIIGVFLLTALHPLKRGIHDLIAGSIVVRVNQYNEGILKHAADPAKVKRVFIISLFATLLIFSGCLYFFAQNRDSLTPYLELRSVIEENTHFENIDIVHNTAIFNNKKTVQLNLSAFLSKDYFEEEEKRMTEVKNAVQALLKNGTLPKDYSKINLKIRSGFNIGIASFYTTVLYQADPEGNITLVGGSPALKDFLKQKK